MCRQHKIPKAGWKQGELFAPTKKKGMIAEFLKRAFFGKNGEPRLQAGLPGEGQRISSTRLLERDLVTGKRHLSLTQRCWVRVVAAGKGSKSGNVEIKPAGPAYLTRTLASKSKGSDELGVNPSTSVERLRTLWKLESADKAYGLIKIMAQIDLWIAAYKKLSPNPGSMTPGGDGGTIDGTSMLTLEKLRDKVADSTYQFARTRRVNIPKPKGGVRSLGIPEFRDRLVQECIRSILESIYEPHFSQYSHGFRPGRSQHTCLRQIRRDFRGTVWYIEGDISKCFESISHQVIERLLRKKIKDSKFLKLIRTGLVSRILLPSGKVEWSLAGTPQGGICSPLFSNIVLDQLDKFMVRLQRIINRGSQKKVNPEYSRLKGLIEKYKKKGADRKEIRRVRKLRNRIPYSDPLSPGYLRVHYTRYADDFLIGIDGSKALAERIRRLVSRFLQHSLQLELNKEKTVITKSNGKVQFLGYLINHGPKRTFTYIRSWGGHKRSVKINRGGNIRLLVDTRKVVQKLANKGFCDKRGEALPNFRYLADTQSFTIGRAASLVRGIDNYYCLANNRRKSTSRFSYIVRHSIAKMFAAKYRVHSKTSIFKRAGKDLSKPLQSVQSVGSTDIQRMREAKAAGGKLSGFISGIPFSKYHEIGKPDLKPLNKLWAPKPGTKEKVLPDPLRILNWNSIRGRNILEGVCAKCGERDNVEMHHVRKLADLRGRNFAESMMIAAQRKQIPLCRSCHLEAHGKKKRSLDVRRG